MKNKQILIRVSENEYDQIKKNAKVCDKTVSAYICQVALNMCIYEMDLTCVTEHTKEISAYRHAVTDLIFTILKRGHYNPLDLEYICNKTNELLASEKIFLQKYLKAIESEGKLIPKTVRKIVNANIEKGEKFS